MITTVINKSNFETTLVETIKAEYQFYLDKHELEGKEYYTLCRNEQLLKCYDNKEEAEKHFNSLTK